MGEVEGSIPSWPLLLSYCIAPYHIILNSMTNKTHWWPSGLRRYVQVVVYYVGAGSNPAQCTILQKMTPEGFEPPAFGFGIQRAAVAPWSHFTCEIASVAQLVERSAVNR